ncbi:hypothetical protein D5400_06240 [Georhizobium profundi]|uniref:Uncharacterized protein n=1 Tax=Georhizobium profundi TaxID=2341112 RepID=A0A3S9B1W5_9HYPH|nr:hypothetical protein [Georhizobium profundi]AZN70926.1 hypothetical protein D5400_06240 [Georhizobium profundi]
MSSSNAVRLAASANQASFSTPSSTASSHAVDLQHRRVVDDAIRQLRSCHSASVDAHWQSAGLIALAAQVAAAEGRMLEQLLREKVSSEPRFRVLDSGIDLPVLEDAERMLALNEWSRLSSLAVDPDRRATRHYRPDLIVIERATSRAIIVDVKRSLSSYSGNRQLNQLKTRMLAAALVAPQILYTEHQRTMVTRTEIAILDLADSRASYGDGIFGLCHLDALLGMPGLAADLQQCRVVYRAAVDALLREIAVGIFSLSRFATTIGSDPSSGDAASTDVDDEDDLGNGTKRIPPHRRAAPIAPVGLARLHPVSVSA